jgi:hypothetical protein
MSEPPPPPDIAEAVAFVVIAICPMPKERTDEFCLWAAAYPPDLFVVENPVVLGQFKRHGGQNLTIRLHLNRRPKGGAGRST